MNDLLGLQEPSAFGTCAILVASPVAPVAGYGVPFIVRNKKQVATAFAQAGNEIVVWAINNGFYLEAPEGNKTYIIAMARTTPLATMFTEANANPVLNLANGDIRLVGAVKFPAGTYVPVIASGFDTDCHAAVIAGQTLSNIWFGKKKPFRFFVQQFAFVSSATALDYEDTANRNGHIVVGTVSDGAQTDNGARALLLALGRASRIQPQQNMGRIKTGSIKIPETDVVKIAATDVEQMASADLDELWDKRYITFEKNETGSGFVFNDDNSLTTVSDDFNNLRYGRVIDNATRVAYGTYYNELKDDVDVDDNGRIATAIEKALETAIETDIDEAMRFQLSKKKDGTADVTCLVNPDPTKYAALYAANDIVNPNFNIIQTNQVYIFVLLKPKGCLKYLNVFLGLTATAV